MWTKEFKVGLFGQMVAIFVLVHAISKVMPGIMLVLLITFSAIYLIPMARDMKARVKADKARDEGASFEESRTYYPWWYRIMNTRPSKNLREYKASFPSLIFWVPELKLVDQLADEENSCYDQMMDLSALEEKLDAEMAILEAASSPEEFPSGLQVKRQQLDELRQVSMKFNGLTVGFTKFLCSMSVLEATHTLCGYVLLGCGLISWGVLLA